MREGFEAFVALQHHEDYIALQQNEEEPTMTNPAKQMAHSQAEAVLEPFRAFAALSLDHTEQYLALQLDTAQTYTELLVAHIRATVDASETPSVAAYVQQQQRIADTVSRQVATDTRVLTGLARGYAEETLRLAESSTRAWQGTVRRAARRAAAQGAVTPSGARAV